MRVVMLQSQYAEPYGHLSPDDVLEVSEAEARRWSKAGVAKSVPSLRLLSSDGVTEVMRIDDRGVTFPASCRVSPLAQGMVRGYDWSKYGAPCPWPRLKVLA